MIKPLLPAIILATCATANDYGPISGYGPVESFGLEPASEQLVRNANEHPNATRTVTFNPIDNGLLSSLRPDSVLKGVEWTWRVNVRTRSNVTFYGPAHRQYDLTWPGDANISRALDNSASLCLTVILQDDFPVNVTNGYTEEAATSGSCAPALGQACVDALLSPRGVIADHADQGCDGPRDLWTAMPECAGTLGYMIQTVKLSKTLSQAINLTAPDSRTGNSTWPFLPSWTSGAGFVEQVSGPVNGSHSREYYVAANQLHIVMLSTYIPLENHAWLPSTQLLCTRVNTTKLPASGDDNGDGQTLGSEVVLKTAGAARDRLNGILTVVALTVSVLALVGW